MRALVVDPNAPERIALGQTSEPVLGAGQVLVKVAAIALNYGELPANGGGAAGYVPGWDAAGTVVQADPGGAGPAVGARVLTHGANAGWAEYRAAAISDLALIPEGVDFGAASALPVAAGTALRALRMIGSIVGRRILVTGASGGVGRFAVQLAHRAGAHVTAVVGSAARGEGLAALGADDIVVGIDAVDAPVFGVIENVGGPTLVRAFQLLEPGGSVISIGGTSLEPAVFPPYGTVGPQRSLISFTMGPNMAADLAYLLDLLKQNALDPQIGWRGSWARAAEASRALLDRKVAGKAVLDLD